MRHVLCLAVLTVMLCGLTCAPRKEDPTPTPDVGPIPDGLKERLDATLKQVKRRELDPTTGFWTIFHAILGMGLDTEMIVDRKSGKRERCIDFVARGGIRPDDGKPMRGLNFIDKGELGADVETAGVDPTSRQSFSQGHQDQFIAEMLQWGIDKNMKFKVARKDRPFFDFCLYSKMNASANRDRDPKQELTWAIIVIPECFPGLGEWTNKFGEKMTFEDIVKYELAEPIEGGAACGGTHRLFGLTWAYHLHRKRGGAKTGVWRDVAAKIETYKKKAQEYQNADGSFSSAYFSEQQHTKNPDLHISTSGHTLEWLSLAMTDEELQQKWVKKAVMDLCQWILERKLTDPLEGGGLYHAVHGLHYYQARVYGGPNDPRLRPVPLPPKD
jgi:hypothetical protein